MPQAVRIITNGVSDGARALEETLNQAGVRCSRVRTSAGARMQERLNLKWGCFTLTASYGGTMMNREAGSSTLNKLHCLMHLSDAGVPVPEHTNNRGVAEGWVRDGCRRIYERHILNGSEGDGIEVREWDREGNALNGELTAAPLYTKGLRGLRREYRIHVFKKDGVNRFFIQQKRRRLGEEGIPANDGSTVRNLAHGWIFAHLEIQQPREATIDAAVRAIEVFGLNFGAVDLIEMEDAALGCGVLEINCAPGLQGATLQFYAEAIQGVIRGVRDEPRQAPVPELPPHVLPLPDVNGVSMVEGEEADQGHFDHDDDYEEPDF